ncbi:MAG TPA: hypothetical protein VHG71_02785 [Verrucomicrobiae bacterium]|nr:hypothetical protein [Verrucomicrobiae bacterium]
MVLIAVMFAIQTVANVRSQETVAITNESLVNTNDLAATTNEPPATKLIPIEDKARWKWDVQLKRQFTDRATPQESSRTTIRMEVTPQDFFLSLIRLDVPFVDKNNGDAFGPHLGDINTKLVSRQVSWHGIWADGVFETVFPNARPKSLGNGKYQFGPGFDLTFPLLNTDRDTSRIWYVSFDWFTKQVFSIAGDSDFKDINYTKAELGLEAVWRRKLSLELTPKPVYDWKQDKSGAVIELESDWNINRHWRLDLVLGHGLWNTSVPTGYESKIEFSVRYDF